MQVTVRHFAVLKERRGCSDEAIEVSEGEQVGQLYDRLFPDEGQGRLPVLFAINHAWAPRDATLANGDVVAFIPPLGGG